MLTYFIHLAYDGSNYSGWQRQTNSITVQEILEQKFELIFKRFVRIYGCGRTDTGVHASSFFAHFFLEEELSFDLTFRLNKHLPQGVVAFNVFPVPDRMNARFSATLRTYDYFIHGNREPILDKYSSYYPVQEYDFEAMQEATALLTSFSDFRAVCKQPESHNTTICNVLNAKLYIDSVHNRLRFTITANRFLRGMIRTITSYLLKIGAKEMTVEEFRNLLIHGINEPTIKSALPNGLYLSNIHYPFLKDSAEINMKNQHQFSIVELLKKGLEDS